VGVQPLAYLLKGAEINGVAAASVYAGHHVAGVYGAVVLFAAGVNIRHQHRGRVVEAGDVIREQRLCPCVAVALEYAVYVPVGYAAGGVQRRSGLRRVMGIVVVYPYAIPLAVKLEPALGVAEGRKA